MAKPIARCQACGKTITAEEISAGISLICPLCADPPRKRGVRSGGSRKSQSETQPKSRK